ncbi:MAG: transporter permease, putative transport system permease protein [Candidatus Saccharibacteria bacterium]|nr:transporter permease, putative transport system permease protein [Candidatus Saccharibacteria bacterium]
MNVITRGIRNAFRNTIRTVSIVTILGLSIGLSLAMLVAHQAVGEKINSVKASVGNTVSISPAGARGFEGGGNALTADQLSKVKSQAHVVSLTESLGDRLTTSDTNLQSAVDAGSLGQRFAQRSGQSMGGPGGGPPALSQDSTSNSGGTTTTFTPPVTVNGTTDPTNLTSSGPGGGGSFTLKSGKVFSSSSTEDVALLGSTLATKNNLKVGSTFTAYNTTITVAGIFDAGNDFSNNQVIMPLAAVQTLSAQPGAITSATAKVDSITNVSSVTSAVKSTLGSATDVTNAADESKNTIAPLENIQTISLYSLIGAVAAGAVIILLTMIMIVRERRREIGVLKAIGAGNGKVVGQFMVEATTLTVLGAFIGIALGVVAGNPITKLLVDNSSNSQTIQGGPGRGGRGFGFVRDNVSSIHAAVGWDIILYGFAAAVLIAVVGSALASFAITKIRPAEVMRTE